VNRGKQEKEEEEEEEEGEEGGGGGGQGGKEWKGRGAGQGRSRNIVNNKWSGRKPLYYSTPLPLRPMASSSSSFSICPRLHVPLSATLDLFLIL